MAVINKNVKIRYKGEQKVIMTFNNLEINDQAQNYLQGTQRVIQSNENQIDSANINTENNAKGE